MLGRKNKRVDQSCVTTHIKRLVFLYLSLIMMLALLKVGLGMLVVGLGVVMVGFKVKVGHELVSDKELDKGGEEIIQVEVEA
jgi:hypothetical protein